jgi:predicted nucleotidyltransferase
MIEMQKLQQKLKTNFLKNYSANFSDTKIQFLGMLHLELKNLNIEYFIIGASARDLLLEKAFGISSPRATLDIDIAICIKNWDQFFSLKQHLMRLYNFNDTPGKMHRINSLEYGALDLIPFGDIENASHHIAWPPDGSSIMNLMGFREAYQTSILIEFQPDLIVRVASIPGLALLKLLAWSERSYLSKDAKDFIFILMNYIHAGNVNRFYTEHADLLEANFDFNHASARMLGRDIRLLLNDNQKKFLSDFIRNKVLSKSNMSFISQIMHSYPQYDNDYEKAQDLMNSFLTGLEDLQIRSNEHVDPDVQPSTKKAKGIG